MTRTEWLHEINAAVEALGWTLLDAIWQGALIVAVYAILRVLLRGPRVREALGHVAMLAFAITPMLTFARRWSGAASSGEAGVQSVDAGTGIESIDSVVASAQGFEQWLPWLVLAWLAGVAVLCLRQAVQWHRLGRLCERAARMQEPWAERFEQLKQTLGVRLRVRLRQSADVAVPMLVGVLRPTILIPAGLAARMPADQLELILLHELAHLRRLDPLFNLLQTGIETLLFYHPGVHWVSRRLREDRELCCDDIVVNQGADRLRYARILLSLAEAEARPVPTAALAVTGGALMQRVERIVALPSSIQPTLRGVGPVGVLLLTALVLLPWLRERAADSQIAPLGISARIDLASMALPALELVVEDMVARLDTPSLPRPTTAPTVAALESLPSALPIGLPEPLAHDVLAMGVSVAAASAQADARVSTLGELHAASTPVASSSANALSGPIAATTLPTAFDAQDSSALEPIVRASPVYPADARVRGLEGSVTLSYRLGRDGRATEVLVQESVLPEEFEQAARDALAAWRYSPEQITGQELKVRFDFVLVDPQTGEQFSGQRNCARLTGSRLCRPSRDAALRTVLISR